jgi:hypothetical protein
MTAIRTRRLRWCSGAGKDVYELMVAGESMGYRCPSCRCPLRGYQTEDGRLLAEAHKSLG